MYISEAVKMYISEAVTMLKYKFPASRIEAKYTTLGVILIQTYEERADATGVAFEVCPTLEDFRHVCLTSFLAGTAMHDGVRAQLAINVPTARFVSDVCTSTPLCNILT